MEYDLPGRSGFGTSKGPSASSSARRESSDSLELRDKGGDGGYCKAVLLEVFARASRELDDDELIAFVECVRRQSRQANGRGR